MLFNNSLRRESQVFVCTFLNTNKFSRRLRCDLVVISYPSDFMLKGTSPNRPCDFLVSDHKVLLRTLI